MLFTSYSQLKKTAEALRSGLPHLAIPRPGVRCPHTGWSSGSKEIPNAVLLGTASFWQGIDIPGDALQCVVIAKLPFAVPDDPIIEARMERLKTPFWNIRCRRPRSLFRQGFGRLIRTRSDRGAVAVLDSRIKTKNYGKWFLRSLPKCAITDDREEFKKLFERLRAQKDSEMRNPEG